MSRPYTVLFVGIALITLVVIPTSWGSFITHHFWHSLIVTGSMPCIEAQMQAVVEYQAKLEEERQLFEGEQRRLNNQLFRMAAVVYQPRSTWHHSLWIRIGTSDGELPFPITKNCPVVVGETAIGLVDYVGEKVSLVRLISHPEIRPAVRVVREFPQVTHIADAIRSVQEALLGNQVLMPKPELTHTLHRLLECLSSSLPSTQRFLLAKGELQGALTSRSPGIFKGLGFNYEYDDDEGSRRDLRTGQIDDHDSKTALIAPGDLLETSGMDALFPRGLKVARVLSVAPLEEGEVSYHITAQSLIDEFPDVEYVAILPSLCDGIPQEPSFVERIQARISPLTDRGGS